MAFYPRVRTSHIMPRIRYVSQDSNLGLAAAVGLKAGMGHALIVDDRSGSPNFGKPLFVSYTVVAIPQIKVVDAKIYKEIDGYLKNTGKLGQDSDIKGADEIRAIAQIVPKDSGFSQKKPFEIEIPITGKNNEEKAEFIKKYIGQSFDQNEVLSKWSYVDIVGITKGRGFQGPVKRFGIKRKQHKSRKSVRAVGTIGPWHPASVMYTVPRAGQMGYHRRTIYNLRIMGISKEPGIQLTTKTVKGNYLLLKGTVPGPVGRPVVIRKAVRIKSQAKMPSIINLSLNGVKI
ncbi:MAG: 50S ribosomal protein L3 [Nitrososphaerota archaeon]|nr:50S ribosomal protein L3 [Nitrososphaerota archaeon]MDG6931359.1 50S ribosomal protein L3 [Nitrososphaerota archaeon]